MKALKSILFTLSALSGVLAQADMPSTHGMLVFGKKTTYASHLPMFHQPHDYQAIFQIEVLPPIRARTMEEHDTAANYEVALHNGRNPYFTIEPQRMDLTKVLDGSITQFKAKLYAGHFERGGQLLGSTRVTVNKVIVGVKLDGEQESIPSEDYYVFGDQDEAFAAHVILERPSFDAIVKLDTPENDEEFELPKTLSMPKTLVGTQTYTVPSVGDVLTETLPETPKALKIESILYLEEAELE